MLSKELGREINVAVTVQPRDEVDAAAADDGAGPTAAIDLGDPGDPNGRTMLGPGTTDEEDWNGGRHRATAMPAPYPRRSTR